jgi:hypothetical protein
MDRARSPRIWNLDEDLGVLIPSLVSTASTVTYYSAVEALAWCPFYKGGVTIGPLCRIESEAHTSHQMIAHAAAVSGRKCIGYASWILPRLQPMHTLLVRETTRHTGTRIWPMSWLHLSWALDADCFCSTTNVLEIGAGCGLLGLSIARAHGCTVTLSDFVGHFTDSVATGTVLHNLLLNAETNRDALLKTGGRVHVMELDWANPKAPLMWTSHLALISTNPVQVKPVDVIVATEVIYTETGSSLLVGTITTWMSKPAGRCYLLNQSNRSGVANFSNKCTAAGMVVEVLPEPQDSGGAVSMFVTKSPMNRQSAIFIKITWQS